MSKLIPRLKISIAGSGGVGKSAMTIQYISHEFREGFYDPTIEDSYQKQLLVSGKMYDLEILDTAGQEEFSSLREVYMRSSEGFILVFDITNQETFDDLEQLLEQIERIKDTDQFPFVLVANKCDIPKEKRGNKAVDKSLAQKLAYRYGAHYFETSAKERINIDTKAFVVESVAYRINIIDTSSSDEFKSLGPNYIKNSDTFYIVFDLCLKSSFDEVDSFYDLIKEIKKDETFTCVLIGNKCEISLTERGDSCVSNFDIIKKAEKMKANYFDVSAKQDINIQKSYFVRISILIAPISVFPKFKLVKEQLFSSIFPIRFLISHLQFQQFDFVNLMIAMYLFKSDFERCLTLRRIRGA
eukprot:gene11190-4010_t